MQLDPGFGDDVFDALAAAGQEARADPVGGLPQPQVEARRLDLVVIQRLFGPDRPGLEQRFQVAVGQNALSRLSHALIPFRQEA